MILRLNLSNNKYFLVELINDEWVHNWAKKIVTLELDETNKVALGSESNEPELFEQYLSDLYAKLKSFTTDINIDMPSVFPNRSNYSYDNTMDTQHNMNVIHRWCVLSFLKKPFIVNGKDITAQICEAWQTEDNKYISECLFDLNQKVHAVETTYTSPGSSTFPCTNHTHIYWDQSFVNDETGFTTKYDAGFSHLLTTTNYDIVLAKRILGKDFRECWLDLDNPMFDDIVNIGDLVHYGFEIDPLNDLSEFYNSDLFKNWMSQHRRSTEQIDIGKVPLGNIINKPENIAEIINTCYIESIELV